MSFLKCLYKNLEENKKGSIIDGIPILIYLLVFGIAVVFSFVIYTEIINAGFFTTLGINNTAVANSLTAGATTTFTALDFMALFLFIGMTISTFIGAFLLRSNPAFFFISLFILAIQVVIGAVFSNTWYMLMTNPMMSQAQTTFNILDYLLSNLPTLILLTVIILSVIIYAVNPFGQEGGF